MPNWVMNRLTFRDNLDDIVNLVNSTTDSEGNFDFNKVIPMPEELNIECGSNTTKSVIAVIDRILESEDLVCFVNAKDIVLQQLSALYHCKLTEAEKNDKELLKKGLNYISNLVNHGHMTWYEWCIENWGTKWNAHGSEITDDYTIIFKTAWSAPHPIIEALSKKYPSVNIIHEWADEDIGNNCGIRDYIGGECIGIVNKDGLDPNSIVFANELWGYSTDNEEE